MESSEKSVTIQLIFIGLIIIGAIHHIFQWNEFSIEVIPLKLKEFAGSSEKADHLRFADICEQRKKPTCHEISLTKALMASPNDKVLLYRLSQVKMERKFYKDVVNLMSQYFHQGGQGTEERFLLSQALFYSGDSNNSAKHLKYILFSSQDRVHPDIARFYVNVLMQSQNWKDARQAIMYYRRRVKNASYFLEKEFKLIQKNLSRSRG